MKTRRTIEAEIERLEREYSVATDLMLRALLEERIRTLRSVLEE